MSKYKTILFDIDDTIIDYNKDLAKAFREAMDAIGYDYTEEMLEDYKEIDLKLWRLFEDKEITIQEVYIKRFEIFFEKYNIKANPENFNKLLGIGFQKTGTPVEGAKEVLEKLSDEYELVITSNGPKNQQYFRLDNADFSKYFSKVFLSEEVGYNKPDVKFFDAVFNSIENKDKSKILIIGDSLSSDIRGGINAGIDTCWFNMRNKGNTSNIQPTYEINNLQEVVELINNEERVLQ